MLAFSKKPKSVETKFSNDKFNYFVGSPITPQLKDYPLLNSGNGVGSTFLKWTDTDNRTSVSIQPTNTTFYPFSVYNSLELENNTGIPINIDTTYKSFDNTILRYPSNTFFEIPEDWVFGDTWTQNIKIKDEKDNNILSYAMFSLKKKGNYLCGGGQCGTELYNYEFFLPYQNANDNSKNPYNDVINPDMIFLYGNKVGNVDEYGYHQLVDKNDTDDFWYLWGGMIYDFGWWYKINQIGINSMFYPQNIFSPDINKKIPIWNLSSIINSILSFNKQTYAMEGLGLINAVAPCIVKVEDYSTLEWGPKNNNFNNKCAKGNTILYIKAARTSTGVNNPSNPVWYTLGTNVKVTKRGMYEAAFPPFYGCFELSTGKVNKKPNEYYDISGNLLTKPSTSYYIIKENQFGICPQIPKGLKSSSNNPNGQSNMYINGEFTCYLLNINFFQNPPDHKPWWCFTKAYEILTINFTEWFNYKSLTLVGDDKRKFFEFPELNNYHLLPKDEDEDQPGSATNILNLTKILSDSKYDKIFDGKNEAILIYPSSLLVYERYPTDKNNEDSIYILINSPGIVLRNPQLNNSDNNLPDGYGNIYIRLRPVDHFYSVWDHFNKKSEDGDRNKSTSLEYYNVINNPLNIVPLSSNVNTKSTWISDNKNKKYNGFNLRGAYTAGASLFNLQG